MNTTPKIGIGLRQPHYQTVFSQLPAIDFVEVHAENFFAPGGAAPAVLDTVRQHYDVSLHCVGLGLGSAVGIDTWHLAQLHTLVNRTDPFLVSDHACFARGQVPNLGMVHGSDLLPIRFTDSSLDILCSNVAHVQDTLKRRIAVENLSAYMYWPDADYLETDFLNALTQRTGCGLLVDVNNIYVNMCNAFAQRSVQERIALATQWIQSIRADSAMEIHLAGFTQHDGLIIDDHATAVHDPVWALYAAALQHFGHTPSLIEWDLNLPPLSVLLDEAAKARQCAHQVQNAHV